MNPFSPRYAAPALILTTTLVYLFTLCPTVYVGDSGELTAAAFSLGIPHNSGYPLYGLLGKVFCLIPLGNIAFRMNLMSVCFAVLTVWLVYSLLMKMTESKVGSLVGALVLAFIPLFWFQTVSAEVYTLHGFFVALLIRLVWWWDERREFRILLLLGFVTGLSFGNHLQTVMLAPAVLWIVLSGDRRALLNGRHFLFLAVFFVTALLVYGYLPIRTEAGAAIHWGDPNTLGRFWAHVSGRSHRGAYVLNKASWEYVLRTKETLLLVWSQFGVVLLFSVWGWVKGGSLRWRVFWVLVFVFDLIYTVFLNIISLKVTAFTLPTCIGLAVLIGMGVAHVLKWMEGHPEVSMEARGLIKGAFLVIPCIFLLLHFDRCNQSPNYTAYEQGVNILRTARNGDTILLNGDNYVFPAVYNRIVERMREDVRIYDRMGLIFRMPGMPDYNYQQKKEWEGRRDKIEEKLIMDTGNRGVFYGVFGPYSITMPEQKRLIPYGILHKVAQSGSNKRIGCYTLEQLWDHYATESFMRDFYRDYMNREVYAYYYFARGKHHFFSGRPETGLANIKLASQIGYDDTGIHSDMAMFLVDLGLFEPAQRELEKASVHNEDKAEIENKWGYFYHKKGDYDQAVMAFQRAVKLAPKRIEFYNNLGFSMYEAGRIEESIHSLEKSLALDKNQPHIGLFIKEKLKKQNTTKNHQSAGTPKKAGGP